MIRSRSFHRASALVLALLSVEATLPVPWASVAFAADKPKVLVVPFLSIDGAPASSGLKLTALVLDEIKARSDVELVSPAAKDKAGAAAQKGKTAADAAALFADGKKALADLKFEEAVDRLKKGLDAASADPGNVDYPALYDAYVSLAVAFFRMGDEKSAQDALFTVARLEPSYKLGEDKYPPVFLREFDKAKKRAEKLPKYTLTLDGPPGATGFIDGRDLGMVPVDEPVAQGTHFVKLEGTRGERFGQVVEVKSSAVRVRGSFPSAPKPSVAEMSDHRLPSTIDTDAQRSLHAHAKAAGAEFVVSGAVLRGEEGRLVVAPILYSVSRASFSRLSRLRVDPELAQANVEAFRLVDEATKRMAAFGAPASLPFALNAPADKPSVGLAPAPSEPSRKPFEPARPAESKAEASDEGIPVWVWVAVGAGVAAAAGGGAWYLTRPMTGRLNATLQTGN